MSFRDVPTTPVALSISSSRARRSLPRRVIVQESRACDHEDDTPAVTRNDCERYNQPYIIHSHGRPYEKDQAYSMAPLHSLKSFLQEKDDHGFMPQLSKNQQLTMHTLQNFEEVLKDLEQCRRGDKSPVNSWRWKILSRTATELDQDCWKSLQVDYRVALHSGDQTAQSAHALMQQEWDRMHTTLSRLLNTRDVSMGLRADDNDRDRRASPCSDDDYFDRVIRQDDIQRIQDKMHMVHDIYRDLAVLVDDQQEKMDKLHDNIIDAKITAEAAAEEIQCFAATHPYLESPCGGLSATQNQITLEDDDELKPNAKDMLEHLISYCDHLPLGCCRTQAKELEVEVLCEEHDDVVEIQYIEYATSEKHESTTFDDWLSRLYSIKNEITFVGKTVLQQECGFRN